MLIFASRCLLELYAPAGWSTRRGVFSGFQRLSFGAGMYTFHDVPICRNSTSSFSVHLCCSLVASMWLLCAYWGLLCCINVRM